MKLLMAFRTRLVRVTALLIGGVAAAQAQIPANLSLPNSTITSGNATYEATTSISATNGFSVSGTANVTFQAGGSITLGPGFTAVGSGTQPSFTALIATPPAANFSLSLPATQSVTLGQSVIVQGTITPAAGFNASVTPIVTSGLPPGVSVTFNPAVIPVSGTSPVPFSMTFNAGVGAAVNSTPVNVLVTAEGAPTEWTTVALTIGPRPPPVLVLTQPTPGTAANPTPVWGYTLMQGYAVEPTPLLPSEALTGVNVSIVRDDDTNNSISGSAVYGSTAAPRYDACGGNGTTGAYPGSPGCPYVNFSYNWSTGPTNGNIAPNAIYTATFSAGDNGSPPVSNSISAVFSVDNQTPSPAISSPVNGSGVSGQEQAFTIVYTSPHSNLDFGYGQVWFAAPRPDDWGNYHYCGIQWTLSPPSVTMVEGFVDCALTNADTIVTNNGANQVTVQLGVRIGGEADYVAGPWAISAFGTNSLGQPGPFSTLTDYTITPGSLGPAILTSDSSIVASPASSGYAGFACHSVLLVNGALGPVTVGAPRLDYWGGSQTPPVMSAQVLSSSITSPLTCSSGSVLVQATFPSGTTNGTGYFVYYPLTDSIGTSGYINDFVVASNAPQFSLTVPSSVLVIGQGTSGTVPITISSSSQGFSGTVNLNAWSTSVTTALDTSSVSVPPNGAATAHLTVTVDASFVPGTYSAQIEATGPSGTWTQLGNVWITVVPNVIPDFTISSIEPVSIQAGQSINFSGVITPVPLGGFSGTVKLTGLSPGDAPGISLPDSVSISTGPQTFTGTITSTANTVSCTYLMPVSAVSGSIQHASYIAVSVQGGAAPSATPSWGGVTVAATTTSSFAVTATATSCFSGTPSFSVSGFPSGMNFTFPSNPPTVTGWAFATSPWLLGNIVVSASGSVGVGSYTGNLTVSFSGGSSYSYTNTLVVSVTPQPPPPTPSYNLSCRNCGSGGLPVTIGAPGVTAFIAIQRVNGYAGSPVLSKGQLPAGISITFDNGATESQPNDVVGVTITATADAIPGPQPQTIYLGSWDHLSVVSQSFSFPILVNGPPLTVTSSVVYSHPDSQYHVPKNTAVYAAASGGVPPYTYTLSNSGASGDLISYLPFVQPPRMFAMSTSGETTNRHFSLTVTDSSNPFQTVTKHIFIPAPQQYPDAGFQAAVLGRIRAAEQIAGSMQSQADASRIRTTIQNQLGITAAQDGSVQLQTGLAYLASQLQGVHASYAANRQTLVNALHNEPVLVPAATPAQLGNLGQNYASEVAATAQITSQVANFIPDNPSAWAELSPDLFGCGTFGCDPCDNTVDQCNNAAEYFFFADTGLVIDPPTGLFNAYAEETLITSSPLQSNASDPALQVAVTVTAPVWGSYSPQGSDMFAFASVAAQISQAGTYTATGVAQPFFGCMVISGGCGQFGIPAITTYDSESFTPQTCAQPTIDWITVDSGTGPQPISELVIGTSGTIAIYGACLDGSSTISVGFDPSSDYAGNSSGVNISNISAPGYGAVTAHYSVTPGTMPETLVLTVTTFSGSASANLDVVTAGPYIEGIIPDAWPANTSSTTVTISGSGFGTNQGALSVGAPGGDVSLVNVQFWSDNQIVMNVSTGPNSAGENVTVTVTGGTDNGLITGFQNSNSRATGNPVSGNAVVAGTKCTDQSLNQLISEYATYNSPLHPNCPNFQPVTAVATGTQVVDLPAGTTVNVSSLNWANNLNNTYNWAIILPALTTGLNSILAQDTSALGITSAYRNPNKEKSGKSRHVYGDAADLNTQRSDTVWQALFNIVHSALANALASGVNYCIEPEKYVTGSTPSTSYSTNSHLHVDWEPGSCPPGWLQ